MELPDMSATAWCVIDGIAVFLDLPGDRFYRLGEQANARFISERCCPVDRPVQPPLLPLPASWLAPSRQSPAIDDGAFRVAGVARALWMQRRTERRLAARSLSSVLLELRSATDRVRGLDHLLSELASREVRAFEHARLLRTAADRCLPRSIALALCLTRRKCRAFTVLGVKLAPFAAHCWVQWGDSVLNDELEEVKRYTPILVV